MYGGEFPLLKMFLKFSQCVGRQFHKRLNFQTNCEVIPGGQYSPNGPTFMANFQGFDRHSRESASIIFHVDTKLHNSSLVISPVINND